LSKNGGIGRTLELARIAIRAGLKLQLGCQVGETAILSAAGRHVAAYLEDLVFVEGSYGSLLLTEDVSENNITFGQGGKAPALQGPGLGVKVSEDRLRKYAHTITTLRD
jgi:muconate cycloisomerase